MALKPGTQLGSYEIIALIGAGGMGEVYKARDAKLNRLVAVKVLPASLAENREFLARFDREAKAVAALSHPNVLGIFDLASQDGLTYAAMELLEGDNLRDRLKAGALPPKRALEIATELALGLGAAHERGIIHRDVKPENIFITREGRVKVLDFGLAKHVARTGGLDTEAFSMAPNATEAGKVLGTVGYMSPEQVRGDVADHRADVFAFGVVLYEMLSGQRPFKGETSAQTMTAILEQDPPALVAARGPLPPALERLVAHCLEKHPEARFQSMKDLAYDLQNLSSTSTDAGGKASSARPDRRSAWRASLLSVAATLALVGLWRGFQLPPFAPPALPSFTRLTHTPGTVESAFFGPDGRTVFFSERIQGGLPELFVLHPGAAEPKPLGIKDALLMGVSATGDLAILRSPRSYYTTLFRGMLAQVSGEGGSIKEVLGNVVLAAWDSPGFATDTDTDGDHSRLEWRGRTLLEVNSAATSLRMLRPSPDSAFLALVIGDGVSRSEIVTFDQQGRRSVRLAKVGDATGDTFTGLSWGPDGDLWYSELVGDQTAVWSLSARGSKRLLWRAQGSQALMDVSRDGRMLIADQQVRRGVLVQHAGETTLRDVSIATGTQPEGFSADGRSLLLLESPILDGGTAQDQAYLWSEGGGSAVRVGPGTCQSLSADGQWVNLQLNGFNPKDIDPAILAAFRAAGLDPKEVMDPGTHAPYVLFVPTGAGRPFALALPRNLSEVQIALLTPDGRKVLFEASDHGDSYWFSMDRQGGAPKVLTPRGWGSVFATLTPLSPDGSRMIVGVNDKFAVQSLSGGEPQPIRGTLKDERVLGWSLDQQSVYALSPTLPATVTRLDLHSGARKVQYVYQPGDASGLLRVRAIYMTPDAKHMAIGYDRELSSLYLGEGLR